MKNLKSILALVLGLSSAQNGMSCDQFKMEEKVKEKIESTLGSPAGGNDKVLKLEKIKVLGNEEDSGDVSVLYTYDQTIGENAESETLTVFHMIGYAKFGDENCEKVDGLLLGDNRP